MTPRIAETRPDWVVLLPWNLEEELVAQLAHVRESGCDRAQGYHFSHPVPADQVDELLARAFELDGRAPSSLARTR